MNRRNAPMAVTWSTLGRGAKAFRLAHAAWSVAALACLAYIWGCVISRRRDRLLAGSVLFLSVEGVALAVGRGDCPMGSFQRRLGDPKPLFELVLSPRKAKAAIPVLATVTLVGLASLVARPPRS